MIDKLKKYETMDGRSVIIYDTDRGGENPIHGAIETKEGWIPHTWNENGESPMICDFDIIEKWEPKVGEWCWFASSENSFTSTLAVFHGMSYDGMYMSSNVVFNDGMLLSVFTSMWKHCYQFEGTIPNHLKDN